MGTSRSLVKASRQSSWALPQISNSRIALSRLSTSMESGSCWFSKCHPPFCGKLPLLFPLWSTAKKHSFFVSCVPQQSSLGRLTLNGPRSGWVSVPNILTLPFPINRPLYQIQNSLHAILLDKLRQNVNELSWTVNCGNKWIALLNKHKNGRNIEEHNGGVFPKCVFLWPCGIFRSFGSFLWTKLLQFCWLHALHYCTHTNFSMIFCYF